MPYRRPTDPVGAAARRARSPTRSIPTRAKPLREGLVGGVERRRDAVARRDHDLPAGTQHAPDLGEERRHVELHHEVEGIVGPGELARVADLEGDPALGIEAHLRLGDADHPWRDVDAAHPRPRELTRDEQRPLTGPGTRGPAPARVRASPRASRRRGLPGERPRGRDLGSSHSPATSSKNRRIGRRTTGQSHGTRTTRSLRALPMSRIRAGGPPLASSLASLMTASLQRELPIASEA